MTKCMQTDRLRCVRSPAVGCVSGCFLSPREKSVIHHPACSRSVWSERRLGERMKKGKVSPLCGYIYKMVSALDFHGLPKLEEQPFKALRPNEKRNGGVGEMHTYAASVCFCISFGV